MEQGLHLDHGIEVQGAVEVGERGHAGLGDFVEDRGAEAGGIEVEQDVAGGLGKEALDHEGELIHPAEVDEAGGVEMGGTVLAKGEGIVPRGGGSDVEEGEVLQSAP